MSSPSSSSSSSSSKKSSYLGWGLGAAALAIAGYFLFRPKAAAAAAPSGFAPPTSGSYAETAANIQAAMVAGNGGVAPPLPAAGTMDYYGGGWSSQTPSSPTFQAERASQGTAVVAGQNPSVNTKAVLAQLMANQASTPGGILVPNSYAYAWGVTSTGAIVGLVAELVPPPATPGAVPPPPGGAGTSADNPLSLQLGQSTTVPVGTYLVFTPPGGLTWTPGSADSTDHNVIVANLGWVQNSVMVAVGPGQAMLTATYTGTDGTQQTATTGTITVVSSP